MARILSRRSRMGTSRRGGGYKSRTANYTLRLTNPRAAKRKAIQRKVKHNQGGFLVRTPFGFPNNFETTLVFGDTYTLTTATQGTPVSKYYGLNTLYDPDPALGGGQPYWFDQFMSIYERYSVLGAKMTATFNVAAGTTTTNIGPWVVGVIADRNTSTAASTVGNLLASQNSDSKSLSGDYKNVTCTATYSPESNLGVTSWDNDVQGTSSSSPSLGWWGGLWAATQGTAGATDIRVTIRIEYRCRFSSLIDNAGS